MTSTSCREAAEEVLSRCLAGDPPDTLPSCLLQEPCAQALFGILVEGLADRFDGLLFALPATYYLLQWMKVV